MKDETRQFSLGTILTRMRVVTDDDLAEARRAQIDGERLGLGELLIARGKLTGAQLEIALVAQRELRSPDRTERALAAARLSKVSGDRVVQICRDVRTSSSRMRESRTDDLTAVGALKEG